MSDGKSEIGESIPIKDAVHRVNPAEGNKRFFSLVSELSDLDAFIVQGEEITPAPEERLGMSADTAALVCLTKEGELVYISGNLSRRFSDRDETIRVLRTVMVNFPTTTGDEDSLRERAGEWRDEGHEVVTGFVIGRNRANGDTVTSLFVPPVIEPDEACYLIRKAANSMKKLQLSSLC